MATYIKTLKEDNGDVTYPQTVADAVHTTKGTTVQAELDQTVTAEEIAQTVTAEGSVTTNMIANGAVTSDKLDVSSLLSLFYPVGCYFETSDMTFNPNASWGGTWVEDTAGRVLVAQDSGTFAAVGATGGEETHQLTVNEMPSHTHEVAGRNGNTAAGTNCYQGRNWSGTNMSVVTTSRGGDAAHNNLQPYIVIKRWHRTA